MLSKNKLLIINNKVYSKLATITKEEIETEINRKLYLLGRARQEYKFICENCGKEYVLLLNKTDYEKRKSTHHYCYECTKTGIIFRGVPKSVEQKEKMRQAYLRRKNQYEKGTSNK